MKTKYLIIFLVSLLIMQISLISAGMPQLLCLTDGQTVRFSLCNPSISDRTCTSNSGCQFCVTKSSTGVYCPASLNDCNIAGTSCTTLQTNTNINNNQNNNNSNTNNNTNSNSSNNSNTNNSSNINTNNNNNNNNNQNTSLNNNSNTNSNTNTNSNSNSADTIKLTNQNTQNKNLSGLSNNETKQSIRLTNKSLATGAVINNDLINSTSLTILFLSIGIFLIGGIIYLIRRPKVATLDKHLF